MKKFKSGIILSLLILPSILSSSQEPFQDAVEKGNLALVKQMINSSNINKIHVVRYWGGKADGYIDISPLSAACMFEKFDIARWLLSQGSDPNGREGVYNSPLWWVAFKGNRNKDYPDRHKEYLKMADELMKKGADPNYNTDPYNGSSLMQAAGGNNIEMISLMRRYGGDPNVVLHKEHGNAADYAERSGHIELANELRGRDNSDYRSSLIYAVKNNNLSGMNKILSGITNRDEKMNLINKQEEKSLNTALHYAAQLGYLDAAKILVENGADINAESLGSFTPLHTAAAYSKRDVAIYLVNQGAIINVVQSAGCATGYTALNWAIEHSDKELIRAMLSNKADPLAGAVHPLAQARTLDIVKMMVEEYNVRPTQDVLDRLAKVISKPDPQYKYYYDEKRRIYNYLSRQETVPVMLRVSSSLKGKDTSFQLFEPFNVNDEAFIKGQAGNKKSRQR